MDEFKLNIFMSMCRHLSFTKAAEDCHVVQSTMSKQIASLEKELGLQLFIRDGRKVRLTPAGQRLNQDAERYANQYRAINASVHKLVLDFCDTLKIGIGLFEAHIIQHALRAFHAVAPTVDLNCMHYSYSTLVSHCRCGTIDLGVGTELCANACPNMTYLPLFCDNWMVTAGKDHPFWDLPRAEQAVLADQVIITTFNNDYEPVRPHCIKNKFPYSAFSYSNTFLSQLPLLQANLGVALLPSYLKPYLPYDLRMEDVLNDRLMLNFVAIYDGDQQNSSLSRFLDCCKDLLQARALPQGSLTNNP